MVKSVHDFSLNKAKTRLVTALKKRSNESTIADLISATGLPKAQVEQAIKQVADEYRGHLRVTESGEILYYFPRGMVNRSRGLRPRVERALRSFGRSVARVAALPFKVWVMFMLVGYFVLFITLLVLAVLASIAASMANRGEGRRSSSAGGFLSFFFVVRVFQVFTWIWLSSGMGDYKRRPARRQGRPLYRSVFAYVFGEEDPNKQWTDQEKTFILSFIRGRKGVLTLDELMVMTGRSPDKAQGLLNQLLIEWEGEPAVTREGTLVYLFPGLLKSRRTEIEQAERTPLANPRRKRLARFADNSAKTNRWISFFNGFNSLFSVYFLGLALLNPEPVYEFVRGEPRMRLDFAALYHFVQRLLDSVGVEAATSVILIVLGIVPLAFSLLFFLVPLVRRRRLKKQNEAIKQENLRKKIYFHVLGSADQFDPQEVHSETRDENPSDERGFVQQVVDDLAARQSAEVEQSEGRLVYRFPELARQLSDVREFRKRVDLSRYAPGETVFDSGDRL